VDYDFDLLTLGAGSGGVAASRRAAMHGAKVAAIEGSRVGGTCVIRGCVPKKLMMYAARYGDAIREAAGYGWSVEHPRFEMARWASAKAAETSRLERVYHHLLEGAKVELIEGWARVDGPHTVIVGERKLTARHLLIATGASPVRDSIPGIEDCATSDELLDLQSLPPRAAVVGSGYIACEFASILSRLGVEVSMFFRSRLPLRGFDEDLRTRTAAALTANGVHLHPGTAPTRIQRAGASFMLIAADERVREFPFVLNATGRAPNTRGLGLETLGITLGPAGEVPVNASLATAAAEVHAIGDVTNKKNLTPVAIAEGRALADSLFGAEPREVDLSLVPSAVFTLPPLATVGMNESEAAEAGHSVDVYESEFRPMRQAFIDGKEQTYMKLLVDAGDQRVLGIHMLGTDAPEIIQSLAVAMSCGATKPQFDRTIAMHPTAAEEFMLLRAPTRRAEPAATRVPARAS